MARQIESLGILCYLFQCAKHERHNTLNCLNTIGCITFFYPDTRGQMAVYMNSSFT